MALTLAKCDGGTRMGAAVAMGGERGRCSPSPCSVVSGPLVGDWPSSDRRLAAEDAHRGEDDRLEEGPADQGQDRGDVEDGSTRLQIVNVEHPVEWGNEDLARVQDERDQVIPFPGV